MRRLLPLLCLAALALPADASKTRLRLERVDASESGELKLYATIVELEGNIVDDRPAAAFDLKLNGKSLGHPVKLQRFQGTSDPLDIVLIVESSALYGPKPTTTAPNAPNTPAPPPPPKAAKPPKGKKPAKGAAVKKTNFKSTVTTSGDAPIDGVKAAVQLLLEAVPPKWHVLVINYGEDVTPHRPFRAAGAAGSLIEDLEPEGEAADLKLIEAVDAALIELKKERVARTVKNDKPARSLVVLISDGLNYNMDKNAFRTLGKAAGKELVPIHTIAFSPQDDRGPLLNLGEISKLSNGTFRWAKNVDDLRNQIETLGDELNKQYVLTFKVDESVEKKTVVLSCGELSTTPYKIAEGAGPHGFGWWWVLIIAGVLGLGGLVVVIVSNRRVEYANFGGNQAALQAQQPQSQQPQSQQQQQSRGAVRVAESQAAPAQPRAVARGTVTVVGGGLSGTRVAIAIGAAPILIGKGPATLQITDDPSVSTRHAQISGEQYGIIVTDLGSTNGTFVNNQRISVPTLLQDGDLVRFGNTQIKFRAE